MKKVKSIYQLTGEEYIFDGFWQLVLIASGSKKRCESMMDSVKLEYRNMNIRKME